MSDSQPATTYYIRVRGRILGPYDIGQLKVLRARGQFSRANEVSVDRKEWSSAASIEYLFQGAVGKKTSSAANEVEEDSPAEPPRAANASRTMAPVWYYAVGAEQSGPVTTLELRKLVASGQLRSSDLVWKQEMDEWTAIEEIAELSSLKATGDTKKQGNRAGAPLSGAKLHCTACGAAVDVRAEVCPGCGVRLDSEAAQSARVRAIGEHVTFAGFWKRLAAFLVDLFVLIAAYWVLALLDSVVLFIYTRYFDPSAAQKDLTLLMIAARDWVILQLGSMVLWWLYHACMESSALQGTLGKMAVAAKVTDLDGNRIDFGRASARYLGKQLSGLIFGVGYLMVAFTQNKQGLHDTMSGCLVLNKY